MFNPNPSETEADLLARCRAIEGYSFGQLAQQLKIQIPELSIQRKGWIGTALEKALVTTAGNQSLPDFVALGIELKTLPISATGKPAESTFVTSIPLLTIHNQTWETSQCWAKLRRVLWILIEADARLPFAHRRIGKAILWSPSLAEQVILEQDWTELTMLMVQGKIHELDARLGVYLQVRPKAADARSLCYGLDESGQKILTLPRGFYLRSTFTAGSILSK
ncbi:MAG: DNA mismatch repair endonuclease MutH [Gammaproteobacteria bacterium]|jgi:DNA mismatch repair protein MutH|nr:DNA mismatch repair endonuclease MutH [Gammaproteobacteria bacterium]